MQRRKTARLRDYRQRFDPTAQFLLCRPIRLGVDHFKPGDVVPEELFDDKRKLQNLWLTKWIERAEAHDPLVNMEASIAGVEKRPRNWYRINFSDGSFENCLGEPALKKRMDEIKNSWPEGVGAVKATGRGWFSIYYADGKIEKVHGQDNVDRRLADIARAAALSEDT